MIAIDMKMPENCVECRFSQGDYGFCHAMPENFCGYINQTESEGKPDWCPLRQADKLMKEQSQQDYEAATEMTEYCERYEPTYNPEDGSL